ncbi:hypothetical protein [Umezawaea tangerina]|uniref:Uncharacterized protein n=1 Tax=Umezawaea tangerina TaxID=84725 RepID=A0A2T0TCC4_9PSEU|nr:hypothetical protein [Umezawaea tangerina]PRY43316.1 hypothetical protein CLV43_10356 [Umezawaea tangerina]
MRSSVPPHARRQPIWSTALNSRESITIIVDRNLNDVPAYVDLERGSVVVAESQLDDEGGLLDIIAQGMAALSPQRPQLAVVRSEVAEVRPAPAPVTVPNKPHETPRANLRLVQPSAGTAACLPGCEYSHSHSAVGDVCRTTVGAVDLHGIVGRDERLSVSVDRFQDALGTTPAVVAVGHLIGGRAQDPQELTPAGARALAAQLLAAADLAEQANKNGSRQTA